MLYNRKYHFWIIIFTGLLFAIVVNYYHYSRIMATLEQAVDPKVINMANCRLSRLLNVFAFHLTYFYAFAFLTLNINNLIIKKLKLKYLKVGAVLVCYIFMYILVTVSLYHTLATNEPKSPRMIYLFVENIWIVALGVSLSCLLILWQKNKSSEIESLKLKEEKKNAQLAVLKDQISPHFFFNTLSSLSSVVRNEDRECALEFIQEMSNTFRYTLSNRNADLIRLNEELTFIKSYVFLLKKRFDDKLLININIGDKHTKSQLPTMSVQMLIENAVNHNIITQTNPLVIDIYIENDFLCVKNNFNPRVNLGSTGMGLTNLSNRYKLLVNKVIVIQNSNDFFIVKLPLL